MALFLAALLVLLASTAEATIYYVRNGGGTTTQCTGTTNANYPGSGTGQACAYASLQDAIDATAYGDTVKLHAGETFSPVNNSTSFNLTAKGTPPTGTDADYITITTDDPTGTPSALTGYPARHVRITTAMAANMPTVRTVGSVPVFVFKNTSKYWLLERLNITNQDAGAQAVVLLANESPITALSQYPDRIIVRLNWIHPIEEDGTVLTADNLSRTAENAIYLEATHVLVTQNAFQGFVGRAKYGGEAGGRFAASNYLVASYSDGITIQNNLLEGWTYAVFFGGSAMPAHLVTQGSTVTSCSGNPATSCTFASVANLSVGQPLAVYVSTSSSQNKWGAAFVQAINGTTVTFTAPLCQSFDGGNSCTDQNGTPASGDAARWNGLLPVNVTVRQNLFAHYPEWTALQDGDCGGKGYLEVKACTNCTFDGNTFVGCSGLTVTVRNQGADFPWANLDNLTFSNNYFKNSNNIMVGYFVDAIPTRSSAGATWSNNLYVGLSTNQFIGGGELSGNFRGGDQVTITHNTVMHSKTADTALNNPTYNNYRAFISFQPSPVTNLTIRNNLFGGAVNVCFVDLAGSSSTSITNCWPSATVTNNVLVNTDGWETSDLNAAWFTPYPTNTLLTTVASVGFTSAPAKLDATGNYRLLASSAYHNAGSDGTDIGVNYPALIAALGYNPNAALGIGPGVRLGPAVRVGGN